MLNPDSGVTAATAVTFTQGIAPLLLAPMFPQLLNAFGSNLAHVVNLLASQSLFLDPEITIDKLLLYNMKLNAHECFWGPSQHVVWS